MLEVNFQFRCHKCQTSAGLMLCRCHRHGAADQWQLRCLECDGFGEVVESCAMTETMWQGLSSSFSSKLQTAIGEFGGGLGVLFEA